MSKRFSFLTSLLLVGALSIWAGCSEDVNQGETCGAGERLNPISGECVATSCTAEQVFNPVTGVCEGASAENQTANGGDGVDNDGNPTYDPDCPFYQCDDENGGSGPIPGGPGDDYNPFQPQDPATAQYHSCDSADFAGITAPRFLLSQGGRYLMAVKPNVKVSNLSLTTGNPFAHVFEQENEGYAGFVLSVEPRAGQTSAADVANWVYQNTTGISGYSATREQAGIPFRTHDNFRAHVLNQVAINTDDAPEDVRDRLVARLLGVDESHLIHNLDGEIGSDGSGIYFNYMTLWRSPERAIIVGAVTTKNRYNIHDAPAQFALKDLTGGTALALPGETMTDECISLELRDVTEVDIIISFDNSGSMDAVRNALVNFSDELVAILNNSGVDWRIGVTGADCNEIGDDPALSYEFRALWPDPDTWVSQPPPIPLPIDIPDPLPCRPMDMGSIGMPFPIPGMEDGNNGRLMGNGFTTDPQQVRNYINMVSQTGEEYTLTMGMAAIDRGLPRTPGDTHKIRPNAAVVLIVVTDENEQLFKVGLPFITGGSDNLTPQQIQEMEEFVDPWVSYLHRPDIAATVFGLYWMPGTSCEGATDIAHGIHHVVERTGGQGDSICTPDIAQSFANIAYASIDIATGLRLVGDPLASSVKVDVVNRTDGSAAPLKRSIQDGFDFISTTYSLFFEGPSTPENGQSIIVPYLKWNNNIIPCDGTNACTDGRKCIQGICI